MTKSEKRALVEECRKSGMTAKEWCASKCIKYSCYTQWATRVNKENSNSSSKPTRWADITSITKNVFGNRKVQLLAIKSAIASTTIFTSSMNLSCGSFYL